MKTRAEKAGLPMMALQRMKPWLVAITLMAPTLQAAGFKPELGVDRHFFDRAKASGMKRQALETIAYQLDRFDQLSPKLQEELLKTTMEDLDTRGDGREGDGAGVGVRQRRGDGEADAAALEGSARAVSAPAGRTEPQLDSARRDCLKQNAGCFIVVGAAHLVGPDGLPALLAKKGYKVTQQYVPVPAMPDTPVSGRAERRGPRVTAPQIASESGLNRRDSWHQA